MSQSPTDPRRDLTSFHAQRAVAGEAESTGWIIERFTPVLLLQARHRLRGPISNYYDPEDLVQDTWVVTIPRLPQLVAREGRWTPVLVRFLSTTLLHKASRMLRDFAKGRQPQRDSSVETFADSGTGVVSVVDLREKHERLYECIDKLGDLDREVLVLRGIEQIPNRRAAERLGEKPSTIAMRYRRALARLREAMPDSVFSEFEDRGDGEESRDAE